MSEDVDNATTVQKQTYTCQVAKAFELDYKINNLARVVGARDDWVLLFVCVLVCAFVPIHVDVECSHLEY